MNVLIADDSATIRTCIRGMLEDVAGVSIVGEAANTQEAISLVAERKPDVAVLDIRMPGGGGLEVLRTVKAGGMSPVTIMLTNYPYPEYRRTCMDAGAEFFFDKSSEFDRIPAVLRMLMESGDARESSRYVAMDQLVALSAETQRLADEAEDYRVTEAQLRRRGAIMHAVGYAADRFLHARAWQDNVDAVVRRLGEASEASRATLFRVDDVHIGAPVIETLSLWVDPVVTLDSTTRRDARIHACAGCMGEWAECLRRGEAVSRYAAQYNPVELGSLSCDRVLSVAAIPVFVDDQWWGVVCFEEFRLERKWSSEEIEALRAAASTLGAAISRANMERALACSESKYRTLVDLLPQFIFECNSVGRIEFVNQSGLRLTGFSAEEIAAGLTVFQLVSPGQNAAVRGNMARVLAGDDVGAKEYDLQCKNGSRLPVIAYTSTIIRNDIAVGIRGVFVDITERKRIEDNLRCVKKEWEDTFEAVPDLVAILDRQHRVARVNRATVQRLGLPFHELVGRDCEEVFGSTHDWKNPSQAVTELLDGDVHRRELHIGALDGTFLVSVSPLELCDGPTGFVLVARDVSELKRTQEALSEYNDRLEDMVDERTHELRATQSELVRREKLAVLGQLAGGIGHELRNPLGVISNAVSYLNIIQAEAEPKVKECLRTIAEEVENSRRIVTHLLDMSRARASNPGNITISSLVTSLLQTAPPPDRMTVTQQIPEGLPPVRCDLDQLNEILGNLLLNAYQAMPDGGNVTLQGAILEETGEVALSVADAGEGIPPENLDKVFEPMFSTRARGLGLGLARSLDMARSNGGRIEVSSEADAGATFTLIFPAATRREEP